MGAMAGVLRMKRTNNQNGNLSAEKGMSLFLVEAPMGGLRWKVGSTEVFMSQPRP